MFEIGEKIVHPMHGAGIIEDIVDVKLDGVMRSYYVFTLPMGGLSMKIPVEHSDEIGIRRLISPEEAEAIMLELSSLKIELNSNWNKRYRENMLRIKSGNLREVACVIKSLMVRDSEKGLSTGERKMLRNAKQILISELVMTTNGNYEEIEQRLNAALADSF